MAVKSKMLVPTEDNLGPMDVFSSDMNKWEQLDCNIETNYLFFDIMIKKQHIYFLTYPSA